MSEQVGSVTRKKSSDFHGRIRFQSRFTIRWEPEDENFIPFSNSVTFRKPRGTDLVTASELIPGFCRSKSIKCLDHGVAPHDQQPDMGDSLRHQIPAIRLEPTAKTDNTLLDLHNSS